MLEEKLLGRISSKDGIKIDPSRVQAIQNIGFPRSKKEIQSFLGKVNFLRRFIPNFAEIVKAVTGMLKKDSIIKLTIEEKDSFTEIKHALTKAPVLISTDFTKDFIVFSFASEHTIAGVLLQKNSRNKEQPIAFFSGVLRDSELKYNFIEKQAYALVKSLKDFRFYVLHSPVMAYVLNAIVKDILKQPDPDGRRGRWIVASLEYDLEIKPTKLVKG